MALLKIARMGHPVLFERAAPVADPTAPEIRRLVADMMQTMMEAPGVGLAAPQVHVPLRLFVYRVPADRSSEGQEITSSVLINPTLSAMGEEWEVGWEGCLSIPGMRGAVPRWSQIRYQGIDLEGQLVSGEAQGFHARVIQHEYDHLDGILYPSRLRDFTMFGFDDELMRAARRKPAQDASGQDASSQDDASAGDDASAQDAPAPTEDEE